jgi:hypothetical protein
MMLWCANYYQGLLGMPLESIVVLIRSIRDAMIGFPYSRKWRSKVSILQEFFLISSFLLLLHPLFFFSLNFSLFVFLFLSSFLSFSLSLSFFLFFPLFCLLVTSLVGVPGSLFINENRSPGVFVLIRSTLLILRKPSQLFL